MEGDVSRKMEALFFTELSKMLMEFSQSSAVTKILLLVIIGLIIFFYRYFKNYVTEIYNEIKYNQDYTEAMDKALEHSLANGYAKARDEKLKQLNDKINRIKRV